MGTHVDIQGTDGITAAWVRRGDWLALVVADPNGPLLATVGQVDGWDDDGVRVSDQLDLSIPWNTIRSAYKLDGPITGPLEFDPQRPAPPAPRLIEGVQMEKLQAQIDDLIHYADAYIDADDEIEIRSRILRALNVR